jgi:23S rRNA pseudouridine2605 synthase
MKDGMLFRDGKSAIRRDLSMKAAMPRKSDDHEKAEKPDSERIAKAIARAGLASRREAEAWIAAGRVTVNGKVINSAALNVTADDHITVDGAPLPARERTRLFLYHKPSGLVTTNADPEGRPTIFGALPKSLPRLLSVGRLDMGTEGLLLLTNDGGLARVLELPETGWLRRYRVRALGKVTQPDLDGLRGGITVDGIHYGPIEATLDREQGSNVWLTFAIREGKNREVRNVLGHLGLRVNRLIRISFGPFSLRDLAEGGVEEVRTRVLREQLGERVIAEAKCDFAAPLVERAAAVAPVAAEEPRRVERARDDRAGPSRHERDGRRRDDPRRVERTRDDRAAPSRHERDGKRRDDPRRVERARDDRAGPSRREHDGKRRNDPRRERESRDDNRPERPHSGKPRGQLDRRDRLQRLELQRDKPPGRPRRGHAWREEDAPLRRHYRGTRTDAQAPAEDAAGPKRAGLLTDRKGRRVPVERFGDKKAPAPAKVDKRPPRQGKSRRPDRTRGPRPSRPRER